MRRFAPCLSLLWLIAACGKQDPQPGTSPATAAPPAVASGQEAVGAATTPADPDAGSELIALRRYEELVNGDRAGVFEVRWTWDDHQGRRVVRDRTRYHRRTARMMGRVRDTFEIDVTTVLLRLQSGELLSMEATTIQGSGRESRTDRETVLRTDDGYAVTTWTGDTKEAYVIPTDRETFVDPETFLGPKVRAGEATPGTTWRYPELATGTLRRVIEIELEVIGPDEEGPGLKVARRFEGNTSLWWFDSDGAVVRTRAGRSVTRRVDDVGLDDLPPRPAEWQITLKSNVSLPRIFTGKRMVVDVVVETDETLRVPQIPANPFTRVLAEQEDRIRLELLAHDDRGATATIPVRDTGLAGYLEATPLMECDDPRLRRLASSVVGDETDARSAAARLADYVFRNVGWQSPAIAEPTALQILENPTGDCSEHCLFFVALCRAAGIPARRASGWVCIGEDWGGHSWCEIWVGCWIGADPTTNEIGTRARYIMLARPDEPEVRAGSITAENTSILIRRAEYDDGVVDFENGEIDRVVFTGIRLGDVPDDWQVSHESQYATIVAGGWQAWAALEADQGYRSLDIIQSHRLGGGTITTFGGRPAVVRRQRNRTTWVVPLGRELLHVTLHARSGEPPEGSLATALAPVLRRG